MARAAITITLPEELIEQIDATARESGKNRSQMLEELACRSLQGQADEAGFVESTQIRGHTRIMISVLRGLIDPEGDHTFDPDRYWLVKFLAKLKPGEKPTGGGMWIVEPESPAPRKKR